MDSIWKGLLAGLAYGLLLGPLFFAGLRVTLARGLRHGVALVGGAFVSDIALATGGWWSTTRLAAIIRTELFQSVFGVAGGLLLFGFGLSAVLPKKNKPGPEAEAVTLLRGEKRRFAFAQGFLLNLMNPSNWFFWLGLATVASADALAGGTGSAGFFLAAALGVLGVTDICKLLIAHRIGKKLKPSWVQNVVRGAGLILMALGVSVLIKAFW